MPIKMPKTLDVPDIERINDVNDVKTFLREFTEILTMSYEHSKADVQALHHDDDLYLGESNVNGSWRFHKTNGHLQLQKRISGTWTTQAQWKNP